MIPVTQHQPTSDLPRCAPRPTSTVSHRSVCGYRTKFGTRNRRAQIAGATRTWAQAGGLRVGHERWYACAGQAGSTPNGMCRSGCILCRPDPVATSANVQAPPPVPVSAPNAPTPGIPHSACLRRTHPQHAHTLQFRYRCTKCKCKFRATNPDSVRLLPDLVRCVAV